MNERDFKTYISGDARFEDDRYWRFSRNSGLPRGYFDRRRVDPDFIVLIVCLIALVVGLVVAV